MRNSLLAACGLAVWFGSVALSWAVPCTVPSGSHATIQAAIQDLACTEITLQSQTYPEDLTIGRSLSLNGVSSAATVIVGQIRVEGATTVVALGKMTVDATVAPAAGCHTEAVVSSGGGRVNGMDLVVMNADGSFCGLFGDGFESGGTTAWSVAVP